MHLLVIIPFTLVLLSWKPFSISIVISYPFTQPNKQKQKLCYGNYEAHVYYVIGGERVNLTQCPLHAAARGGYGCRYWTEQFNLFYK